MPTLTERIARLETELKERIERAEKATPKWWFKYRSLITGDWTIQTGNGWLFERREIATEADVEFVVYARTEHPQAHRALLETVYRLQILLYADPSIESVADSIVGIIERELGVRL